MRQWRDGRILNGIAVISALCLLFCSGCLKSLGEDESEDDNGADGVVTNNDDVASTNDVPDDDGGGDGTSTNDTDDTSGGGTNDTDDVSDDADTPKVYVAIGDCMTVGGMHPGPSFIDMLEDMLGVRFINEARDSDGSKDAVQRVPGILARHKPDYMTIVLGTMDATGQWEIEGFYQFYYDIVEMTLDAGCTPVLATFPPQMTTERELERSMQLNAEIRRVAARYRIPFVDLEEAFDFDRRYYQADLWHPNAAGSELMAVEFYRVMRDLVDEGE